MSDEEEGSEGEENEPFIGAYVGDRNEAKERHGFGEAILPNGDRYKGAYQSGKRNGYGMYVFKNGARYDGEYVDNKRSGRGLFVYPDGSIFCGAWSENKRNGFGIYIYPNTDRYEGEWVSDVKQGNGIYYYVKENCKYVGMFEKGLRQGAGETLTSEYRYSGNFQDDLVSFKKGFLRSEVTLCFSADMFNAPTQPHGKGRFVFFNGYQLDGEYIHLDVEPDENDAAAAEENADGSAPKPKSMARWIAGAYQPVDITPGELVEPGDIEVGLLRETIKCRKYFEAGGQPGNISEEELSKVDSIPIDELTKPLLIEQAPQLTGGPPKTVEEP